MAIYGREQTELWLSWMARHLRRRGRTIFLLERIDESWLGSRGRKLAYLSIFSVIFALSIGSILWAFDALSIALDSPRGTGCPESVPIELWFWWLASCLWAFAAGVLTWFRPGWLPSARLRLELGRWWRTVADLAFYWGIWLVIWILIRQLLVLVEVTAFEWTRSWMNLGHPVLIGLLTVLVYGYRYGLGNIEGRVPTVEALGWSWRSAFRGLAFGLLFGGVLWVVYAWIWRSCEAVEVSRNLGVYLPVGGTGSFLVWGLRMRIVEKSRPNEGIRRSFANALLAGAFCGAGIALVCWPVFQYVLDSDARYIEPGAGALAFGALAGAVAALWFGGMDFFRHWMLRLALIGTAPWRWIGFLQYAAVLGLLRRVGGGYMFIHRFVLDHFADRAVPKPE